jgi:hypothetical protein
MKIDDDGNRLVLESKPWLIGKIFGVVFIFLSILMPLVLILSLVLPPNHASIDCDRSICRVAHGAWKKEVPVADIAAANLEHSRATRNSSSAERVKLVLQDHSEIYLSESGYRDRIIAGMKTAVDGVNQFLSQPAQTSFHAEYTSSDTDYSAIIPMAIFRNSSSSSSCSSG